MANSLDILIQAQDNATSVLESIQSRINTLGNDGPSAFSRIDAAATSVHSRLTGLYAVATTLFAAFTAGKLVQVPAEFESLSKQLETVTKSSAKAEEGMAWVQAFAQKTPYELDKVASAFAKLTSYGFDPKTILEPIGNAASGMQKDLDQAVEAFADATRGEFERLKEFGINAQVTGNQVTLSYMQNGQQMEKTVTKNAENMGKALSGIWTDLFAGGMENQMTTFSGRLSNLLDAATRGIQTFMGAGLFDSIKGALSDITDEIQKLERSGKLESWGKTAKEAFDYVWASTKRLGSAAADFMDRWGALLKVLGTVAAIALATEKLGALSKAVAASKLGMVGLALAVPDAIEGYKNLALAANEYFNSQSQTNRALRQAAQLQAQATANNSKAVAMLNEYAKAQGETVTSLEDWRKKIADGTIKLKDHTGQIALTADEYKILSAEIKKAGEAGKAYTSQVGDRYDQQAKEAKALAATEGAAAAAGLTTQLGKYNAVLSAAKGTAAAQIRLIELAAGTEAQKASLRQKVEEELQKSKAAALKDWLDALKTGLDEALAQEKRYAQEAENAHKTTEEKLRDLKRQTMSASAAYYDEVAAAREKLAAAETEAAKGTAEGYDNAIKLAKEAQNQFAATASSGKDIVGNAAAVQTAMQGVAEAGSVWETAANSGKQAWADTVKTMKEQIQEAKAALDALQKNPLSIAVDVDTSAADKALEGLNGRKTTSDHSVTPDTVAAQSALAELKKPTSSTHTIYVRQVEQYAAGGPVAREVPAMVMPGEVVVEPEAANHYAPLLHAINSLRLPVAAVPHFAGGGSVFRPFRRGLVPGVGDEDSEPVLLREGAFVVRKAAVSRYGAGLIEAMNNFKLPAGVQTFASGGFVLPDWLQHLRQPVPSPSLPASSVLAKPAAPTPLSVALSVPAAFSSVTTPMATPVGMSDRGAAAVARLDGLRHTAALKFSSGGSLDETLADIALERQRTKEDYDEAVTDAKTDHDDQLADLLKQEQEDLDQIAADLAEAVSAYNEAMADAQQAYAAAVADARAEWAEKKADLQSNVDDAQKAYFEWQKKGKEEHPGYKTTTVSRNMTGFVPGGGLPGTRTVYTVDKSASAKKALEEYQAEGKELTAKLTEARQAVSAIAGGPDLTDATSEFDDAKAAAVADMADARSTVTADTQSTKEKAESDKADLEKDLADKLADLKKDFDRAMEDLDIEESRARANADDTKGYSISGFTQWLRNGGPVQALTRIRRFAEGGVVGLLGKLPQFAGGGTVPMVPGAVAGVDSVLAALTPGEGVVKAEAMAKVLSERALDALNNLDLDGFFAEMPHFATGGVVPGGDVSAVPGPSEQVRPRQDSGASYTATLNLAIGGKSFETRTTSGTAQALARELRKMGVNVR